MKRSKTMKEAAERLAEQFPLTPAAILGRLSREVGGLPEFGREVLDSFREFVLPKLEGKDDRDKVWAFRNTLRRIRGDIPLEAPWNRKPHWSSLLGKDQSPGDLRWEEPARVHPLYSQEVFDTGDADNGTFPLSTVPVDKMR